MTLKGFLLRVSPLFFIYSPVQPWHPMFVQRGSKEPIRNCTLSYHDFERLPAPRQPPLLHLQPRPAMASHVCAEGQQEAYQELHPEQNKMEKCPPGLRLGSVPLPREGVTIRADNPDPSISRSSRKPS
ncbi:hypothetical protein UY3_00315 [Chelonia mydas]|uniref:Uncharacterized protein n=1 Tax=Chelonia mydas TaxID=8469 RepID=M7CCH7_CHEMY|nr:hypothetical protein UY3_00315 [Chelonia mydas]